MPSTHSRTAGEPGDTVPLDLVPAPLALLDPQGPRVVRANAAWQEALAGEVGSQAVAALLQALPQDGERFEHCIANGEHCRRLMFTVRRLPSGLLLVGLCQEGAGNSCTPEAQRLRDHLRLVARTARLGFWDYDFIAGRFEWSEEIWRMAGRAPGSLDLTDPEARISVYHPEDRAERRRLWQRVMARGIGFEHRARMLRPDGTVIHTLTRGIPQRDAAGRVVRCFGVVQDIGERVEAERKLEAARAEAEHQAELLREATRVLFGGFALFDPDDRLVLCNADYARLYDCQPEEMVGMTFEQTQRLPGFRRRLGLEGDAFEVWLQGRLDLHRRADGRVREIHAGDTWILVQERRLPDGSIVLCRTDISDLKRKQRALTELARELARAKSEAETARDLLRGATAALADGFALFDPSGCLVLCNEAYARRFDSTPEALVGQPFATLARRCLAACAGGEQACALGREELEAAVELCLEDHRRGDGTPREMRIGSRWYVIRHHAMADGHRVVLVSDITHLKRTQEELRRLATVDDLTGLYNRRHFFATGARLLERLRCDGRPVALLLFDLDHFKRINDTFGHEAGDRVLAAVAQRCREVLRPGDLLARLGGEEFAVLLPETPRLPALRVAERLRRAVAGLRVEVAPGRTITPTISVGFATAEEVPGGLERLLAAADRALYRAKAEGRDRVAVAADDGDKQDETAMADG